MTPQEKKRVLVDSYAQSYRRAGIPMTAEAIERQVISDCELVDAAERNGELCGGGTPDPTPTRQRPDVIAEAEQKLGVRRTRPPRPWRPALLYDRRGDERWLYARGRIARILEQGATNAGVVDGRLGVLQRELLTLHCCFLTRSIERYGSVPNPFYGLSDKDCLRLFRRKVEDICDRSTGVLGHWYVK